MSLIIHFQSWNRDTSLLEDHYLCAGTGMVTAPGASPANTFYDPSLESPFSFSRHVFGDGRTAGRSDLGIGNTTIINTGEYDFLKGRGFNGRLFEVHECSSNDPGSAVLIFRGTMEDAEFSWDTLNLIVRDKQSDLDAPVQTTLYAGTDTGTGGSEGDAQLKDRPRPLCFGLVRNVTPALVNAVDLLYQLHDGPMRAVDAVRDNGIALTLGVDHATLAALQAATPGAATYDTCLAEGYFRLGSTPTGAVTADARGDDTGGVYVDTVGRIIPRIAQTYGGLSGGDIDTAAFTAIEASSPYTVGIYLDSETPVADVFDQMCESVGAWWNFNRFGVLTAGVFNAPTDLETPEATFTTLELLEGGIRREQTNDFGGGIPTHKVEIRYRRNWTIQDSDGLAGAIGEALRQEYSEEYRSECASDLGVKTSDPQGSVMTFDTLLDDSADASSEAVRRHAIYKVPRDRYQIEVPFSQARTLDLGDIVALDLPRFDLEGGKNFAITGIEYEITQALSEGIVRLDLYG